MKVSKLFIIGIGANPADAELRSGMEALFFRYTQFKGLQNVQSIVVDTSRGGEIQELAGKTNREEGNDNVGVYIVGHGSGLATQRLGGWDAIQVAEFLSHFLSEQGIKTLRKVCIVSCGLGVGPLEGSKPFLEIFAEALAAKEPSYEPMVAGWDAYVSICFPDMKLPSNRSLYSPLGNDKVAINEEYIGRKLVKYNDKYRLLNDEMRKAQKRFFWIKNKGEESKLDLAGWHDQ